MSLCNLTNTWPPFRATTWLPSVHERCLLAVRRQIRSLELPGLNPASVVIQRLQWSRDFTRQPPVYALPGVIISTWGSESMDSEQGTNLTDQVEYPVCVSIVAGDEPYFSGIDIFLWWREQLARSFRNQPLAGIPEITNCVVAPGAIVVPEALLRGVYHSSLVLQFTSLESRST
ncbi:MAG TPA: hypothetical protein VHZ24_20790 [Pirellulales bacterium]|jgi:hypothetical protein|nr:hypothetical protein [Pirellulales bacterium]